MFYTPPYKFNIKMFYVPPYKFNLKMFYTPPYKFNIKMLYTPPYKWNIKIFYNPPYKFNLKMFYTAPYKFNLKMLYTPPYKFNLKMFYTPLCKRLVWHYSKHILILLNEPLNYLTVDKVFLILMSINRLLFSKKRLRISVNENAIPSLEQLQRCSLYELTN